MKPDSEKAHVRVASTASTSSSTAATAAQSPDPPIPPPLNYSVYTKVRQRKIIIFFTFIFIEAGVLPLILFYSIRWGAHLNTTTNLAIITSVIGTYSSYNFTRRLWYLLISDGNHQRRPIGASRWGVDAMTIMIVVAMTGFFTPLIVGSSVNPGSVKTVATALPIFMLIFSIPMFLTSLFPHRIRVPFRVSSLPSGAPLPPLPYTIAEDIVAVDGGGCVEFRQAWRLRYEHSAIMRRTLCNIGLLWGFSGVLVATALIVVAWTTTDDIAYGCGYGLPWLWAMVCAAGTIHYVRRQLVREWENWAKECAHLPMSLQINQASDAEKMAERTVTIQASDVGRGSEQV